MASRPSGTVTFIFADVEGIVGHGEHGQSPEAMRNAFVRHETIPRQAIEANGGFAYKMMGSALQAAFHTAPQAVVAAIAAQRALHEEPWN